MNFNILGYILIALIAVICIRVYQSSDSFQLKCVVSDVDGNKYCVRERAKLVLAADLLAQCTVNMKKLVAHMETTHPGQDNVRRLVTNFDPHQVCETLPTSEFTAYSENKGEKLAFCLNTTKEGGKLIDPNTLMFIALHEMAHIMTESIGHKDEFWKNSCCKPRRKSRFTSPWITRRSRSSTAALKSTTTPILTREGREGSFSGCMLSSPLRNQRATLQTPTHQGARNTS